MFKTCLYIATLLCFIGMHGVLSGEVIGGGVDCGSAGTLVSLYITGCTVVPCELVIDVGYIVEFNFKLSKYYDSLHVHVDVINGLSGTSYPVYDVNIGGGAESDVSYLEGFTFTANSAYAPLSTLNIKITGSGNPNSEICRDVPLLVL